MAGRDHHAHVRTHFTRKQRDSRRGQGAGHNHIYADAGKTRHQGGFHHVTGQTRVLADHNAMPMVAAGKMRTCRLPDAHRHGRSHYTRIGTASDPVSAEKLASHLLAVSPNAQLLEFSSACGADQL